MLRRAKAKSAQTIAATEYRLFQTLCKPRMVRRLWWFRGGKGLFSVFGFVAGAGVLSEAFALRFDLCSDSGLDPLKHAVFEPQVSFR